MKSSIFTDAIESSTKVFGRNSKLKVVFEGGEAETTGAVVKLPALPPAAEVSVDQADIIRGYRDHEAMHVRCTDTGPKMMNRLEALKAQSHHHHTIAQYCEDIRIENAGIQEYAGMKHGLTATNTHAAKMLLQQIEERGDPATVVASLPKPLQFRMMLQSMARASIGVGSDGVFEALNEHIRASDPALYNLAAECAKEMTELPTGMVDGTLDEKVAKAGTSESFELAEKIFYQYEDYEANPPPPPPPPPQGGNGSGQGGGQGGQGGQGGGQGQGSGSGQGSGQGSGGGGSSSSGQPGQQDGGAGSQPGNGGQEDGSGQAEDDVRPEPNQTQKGGGGGPGGANPTELAQGQGNKPPPAPIDTTGIDVDDLYKNALNDVVEDINGQAPKVTNRSTGVTSGGVRFWTNKFSTKWDVFDFYCKAEGFSKAEAIQHGAQVAASMVKEISGKRAMIRRILELELQARSDRRWESGFKHGRLQSIRVVDAMQGREAVYQRRTDGKDMDTLLHISIDGSGSMDGSRARSALMLSLALSEALERTGCDIQVEMWGDCSMGGRPGCSYTEREFRDSMQNYHNEIMKRRNDPNRIAEYVSFGLLTRAVIKDKRRRTTLNDVVNGFGVLTGSMNTGTPTYTAVFQDLNDLAKEQYSKKIYLHITDGEASHPNEGQAPAHIMAEAQRYAKAIGVHMIGVGIDGMKVNHLFKDFINVRGADAYEPVMKKLAKLISQEAGHEAGFKRAA